MAYSKRVYTGGIEDVTYLDMNRIEIGIETNDKAIAKKLEESTFTSAKAALETSIATSLATAKTYTNTEVAKRVLQTAYDTKMTALDSKNTSQDTEINKRVTQTAYDTKVAELNSKNVSQDTAITEKVKLNGTSTNVNFKKNEVVQDGLVKSYTAVPVKTNTLLTLSNGTNYTAMITLDTTRGVNYALCGNIVSSTSGFYIEKKQDNRLCIVDGFDSSVTNSSLTVEDKFTISVIVKNGIDVYIYVGNILYCYKKIKIEGTSSFTLNGIGTNWQSATNIPTITNAYVYSKELTPREINHNISVLSNSLSISSIETTDTNSVKTRLLLSSDTDHVETRTGHTEEERYVELLKTMGKKFTSNGSDITVNNAIAKQRVISGKISGQTVKNLCPTVTLANIVHKSSLVVVDDLKMIITLNCNGVDVTNPDIANLYKNIEPNKSYILKYWIYENTLNVNFGLNLGTSAISTFSTSVSIPIGFVGSGEMEIKAKADLSGATSFIRTFTNESTTGKISYSIAVFELNSPTSKDIVPFGLSSTQAIISNVGIKYPFYKLLEDKTNGNVIELGGVENAKGTLEILEDGSGILTQNTMQQVYDGSIDEIWSYSGTTYDKTNTILFWNTPSVANTGISTGTDGKVCTICDKFNSISASQNLTTDVESIACFTSIRFRINKSRLETLDAVGFQAYLLANPITVCYQLLTPIVTYISKEIIASIVTQQTNIFSCDSAVKPSSIELTVATTDDISKSYAVTLLNGYTQTTGTATPVVNLLGTGIVRLQMDLTTPSTGMNSTLFTLPTEIRPITNARIPVYVNGVSQLATIDKTTGNVNLSSAPSASANIYIKTDYRRDI